jgi:hypothetical protein
MVTEEGVTVTWDEALLERLIVTAIIKGAPKVTVPGELAPTLRDASGTFIASASSVMLKLLLTMDGIPVAAACRV